MVIYNELLRIAQMAKAGEISTSLKAGANALQGAGKRGAQAVSTITGTPSARVGISKFAQWAAIPAGIGVGVGVGGLAAGKGIEAGFGFNPFNPAQAGSKLSGVLLFAGLAVVGVYLLTKVMKRAA